MPEEPALVPSPALAAPQINQDLGSVFQIDLDGSPRSNVVVPPGMLAESTKAIDDKMVLSLSGGNPATAQPGGITGGYSVRVPDSIEAAASGNRVRVSVRARAANGIGTAEFSLAYSTCEVGNSGWRKFTAGDQFAAVEFKWDVPTMIRGNGDYVGILPALDQGIEIEMLVVEAMPRS
jgi:hypothetical protein